MLQRLLLDNNAYREDIVSSSSTNFYSAKW